MYKLPKDSALPDEIHEQNPILNLHQTLCVRFLKSLWKYNISLLFSVNEIDISDGDISCKRADLLHECLSNHKIMT